MPVQSRPVDSPSTSSSSSSSSRIKRPSDGLQPGAKRQRPETDDAPDSKDEYGLSTAAPNVVRREQRRDANASKTSSPPVQELVKTEELRARVERHIKARQDLIEGGRPDWIFDLADYERLSQGRLPFDQITKDYVRGNPRIRALLEAIAQRPLQWSTDDFADILRLLDQENLAVQEGAREEIKAHIYFRMSATAIPASDYEADNAAWEAVHPTDIGRIQTTRHYTQGPNASGALFRWMYIGKSHRVNALGRELQDNASNATSPHKRWRTVSSTGHNPDLYELDLGDAFPFVATGANGERLKGDQWTLHNPLLQELEELFILIAGLASLNTNAVGFELGLVCDREDRTGPMAEALRAFPRAQEVDSFGDVADEAKRAEIDAFLSLVKDVYQQQRREGPAIVPTAFQALADAMKGGRWHDGRLLCARLLEELPQRDHEGQAAMWTLDAGSAARVLDSAIERVDDVVAGRPPDNRGTVSRWNKRLETRGSLNAGKHCTMDTRWYQIKGKEDVTALVLISYLLSHILRPYVLMTYGREMTHFGHNGYLALLGNSDAEKAFLASPSVETIKPVIKEVKDRIKRGGDWSKIQEWTTSAPPLMKGMTLGRGHSAVLIGSLHPGAIQKDGRFAVERVWGFTESEALSRMAVAQVIEQMQCAPAQEPLTNPVHADAVVEDVKSRASQYVTFVKENRAARFQVEGAKIREYVEQSAKYKEWLALGRAYDAACGEGNQDDPDLARVAEARRRQAAGPQRRHDGQLLAVGLARSLDRQEQVAEIMAAFNIARDLADINLQPFWLPEGVSHDDDWFIGWAVSRNEGTSFEQSLQSMESMEKARLARWARPHAGTRHGDIMRAFMLAKHGSTNSLWKNGRSVRKAAVQLATMSRGRQLISDNQGIHPAQCHKCGERALVTITTLHRCNPSEDWRNLSLSGENTSDDHTTDKKVTTSAKATAKPAKPAKTRPKHPDVVVGDYILDLNELLTIEWVAPLLTPEVLAELEIDHEPAANYAQGGVTILNRPMTDWLENDHSCVYWLRKENKERLLRHFLETQAALLLSQRLTPGYVKHTLYNNGITSDGLGAIKYPLDAIKRKEVLLYGYTESTPGVNGPASTCIRCPRSNCRVRRLVNKNPTKAEFRGEKIVIGHADEVRAFHEFEKNIRRRLILEAWLSRLEEKRSEWPSLEDVLSYRVVNGGTQTLDAMWGKSRAKARGSKSR